MAVPVVVVVGGVVVVVVDPPPFVGGTFTFPLPPIAEAEASSVLELLQPVRRPSDRHNANGADFIAFANPFDRGVRVIRFLVMLYPPDRASSHSP